MGRVLLFFCGHHQFCEYVKCRPNHCVFLINDERPALTKMLRAANQGTFDAVVVNDYARLARDSCLLQNIENKLNKHGVKVISIKELDACDSLTLNSLQVFLKDMYRDDMSRKIKMALRIKKERNPAIQ